MENENMNQGFSDASQTNLSETITNFGSEKLVAAMLSANLKAEKELNKRAQGKTAEEVEKIKGELVSKYLQNEIRSTVYQYSGGFQPTQKRYWTDVGVRALANTSVLFASIALGAFLLRNKNVTVTTAVTESESNPFPDIGKNATQRPQGRRESAVS